MPANRPQSPSKSPKKRSSTANGPEGQDTSNMTDMIHQLQMGLSEKDIEIERLKITVVSLNTKCTVVDDHIEDLKNTTDRLDSSEAAREGLQNHITDAAKKIDEDNNGNTDYQNELTNEIEALKKQLQQQKQEQFEMEQQKDAEKEEVRQRLEAEMNQVRDTLLAQMTEVRTQLTDEKEQVRSELLSQLDQVF